MVRLKLQICKTYTYQTYMYQTYIYQLVDFCYLHDNLDRYTELNQQRKINSNVKKQISLYY